MKSSDVSNDVNEEEEPRTRNSFVNLCDGKNSVRKEEWEKNEGERRKKEKEEEERVIFTIPSSLVSRSR